MNISNTNNFINVKNDIFEQSEFLHIMKLCRIKYCV